MSSNDEATMDVTKFEMASTGSPEEPEMLIITVPIKHYAQQGNEGMDMFYGKMKRVEATGSRIILDLWKKRDQKQKLVLGGIGPDGKPYKFS